MNLIVISEISCVFLDIFAGEVAVFVEVVSCVISRVSVPHPITFYIG